MPRRRVSKPDPVTSLLAIVASAVSGFVAVLTANSGEQQRIEAGAKTAVSELVEYRVGQVEALAKATDAGWRRDHDEFIAFKTQLGGDLRRFADTAERDGRAGEARFAEIKGQLRADVERLREECGRGCSGQKR